MIFIIGGNRCGSSLVGKILKELGVDINCDDEKPAKGFKRGYCEVQEDPRLKFIVDVAYPHKSTNHCLTGKYTKEERNNFREGFKKLPDNVGMKWRRLMTIMPLILENATNPKVIYCNRDKKLQAKSVLNYLLSRQKHTEKEIIENLKQYEAIVDRYFEDKNVPIVEVWYESLIENPEKEVKKIAEFIGVPYKEEAKKVIKPKLRHF